MYTSIANGVKFHRHSLCFILLVKILWLLFIVPLCHLNHLPVRSYPSNDDNIRGTLPIVLVVPVAVVSAWLPTTNQHFYKTSSTRSTISQSLQQLLPLTILQKKKKKKTTNEYTDDATINNNIDVKNDVGSTSTTTTANAQSYTKQEQERYEQNLILELQRCITVEDVLHRVGSLLSSDITTCTNDATATTFTTTTTISSIQIWSLVLIRLSKLYIQMNNQQIYYVQQVQQVQQHQQQLSDSAERGPIITHQATMTMSSLSILRNIIHHFIQISSHSINMLSSNTASISYMIDSIVDGTKACAVLARLIPLTLHTNDIVVSSYSICTKPLVEFYTTYGSVLIPYMQSHHISGLKWALDCLLLSPSTDDKNDLSSSNMTLLFPQSIQDAYNELNLPFCILPRCLSMTDTNNNIPITVDRIVRQVDFRTDEIYTTGSGESVTERRLTAWQGDSHVAPFAYSGKAMDRNDWSPIVLHIRDQLYNITGQYYDGCLLNLYYNGKSGMRYHSDPDQGILWDSDTAVVSIGASRRFTFRSIDTATTSLQRQPHSFIVMDSDVTYMFNDCQQLYQHSVKNAENKNETTSRISLVFKRTFHYYDKYLH